MRNYDEWKTDDSDRERRDAMYDAGYEACQRDVEASRYGPRRQMDVAGWEKDVHSSSGAIVRRIECVQGKINVRAYEGKGEYGDGVVTFSIRCHRIAAPACAPHREWCLIWWTSPNLCEDYARAAMESAMDTLIDELRDGLLWEHTQAVVDDDIRATLARLASEGKEATP
jgi:hypothetical protein